MRPAATRRDRREDIQPWNVALGVATSRPNLAPDGVPADSTTRR
jgi:hypothetical protein